MARKYVVIVHGLMINNGTVAPYGTEVTDDIEVTDPEKKVEQGYLLSKADFDKKTKEDAQAVADSTLSPEEKSKKADQLKADAQKVADKKKADEAATAKAEQVHADLLDAYKKQFDADAPTDAPDDVITKALKDKLPIINV